MDNRKIDVAIITGNELRHKFFASYLSRKLKVKLVIYENKANIHNNINYGIKGNKIVKEHFEMRLKSERKFFSNTSPLISDNIIKIKSGDLNSQINLNRIINSKIKYILLFGSSIIGDDILEKFENKVINLHLGLSPYYRGSGTNFWPLVDSLPECVGATIHLAIKKIDAGGVLKQLRPDIAISDNSHDIGNNVILKSIKLIPSLLDKYDSKTIFPIPINVKKGKLFLRKDLTIESIKKLYHNFQNNMIEDYLKNKSIRQKKYPIIE